MEPAPPLRKPPAHAQITLSAVAPRRHGRSRRSRRSLRGAERERARVVVVSSGAQLRAGVDFDDPQFERRPYDPFGAYAQSKTAEVLLAIGISRRWAEDGISANTRPRPDSAAWCSPACAAVGWVLSGPRRPSCGR